MPRKSMKIFVLLPVLFALASAFVLIPRLTASSPPPLEAAGQAALAGAPEPSGPLNAGARLVRLVGTGRDLRAVVEVKVLSHLSNADVEIRDTEDRKVAAGRAERGRPQLLTLESPIAEGEDNHLRFRVSGRKSDGTTDEVDVYLLVALDESTAPSREEGLLVYQGATLSEVQE